MFDNDKQPDEELNNVTDSLDSDMDNTPTENIRDGIDTDLEQTKAEDFVAQNITDIDDSDNFSEDEPVTVQPVQFASFDEEENTRGNENRNLDLLMNVNLQMSVELGRTELPFKKVLELTRGSIISLDKLAGEPVELYANGKLVAYGEVVVIEDNFGLRITSIAAPEERLTTVREAKEKEKEKEKNKE